MFDFSLWWVALFCFVFAVAAGFVARRIWRGWVEEDPHDREGGPQFYAVVVVLFLFVVVGWSTLTVVPQGGVALGNDGTIFVNTSPTRGRMVLGNAKVFLPRDMRVRGVYTTGGQNARSLVYTVDIRVPSRSLAEVARFEWEIGYTLEERIDGLLWEFQAKKAEELEGFNNPADLREQHRFSRLVGEWFGQRVPEGVIVLEGAFRLEIPTVY